MRRLLLQSSPSPRPSPLPPPVALSTLITLLSLATLTTARRSASLPKLASLTLFSDPHCSSPLFINDAVIGPDFCSAPLSPHSSSSSSIPADTTIQSYILTQRPFCANGSLADIVIYADVQEVDPTAAWYAKEYTCSGGGVDRCVSVPGGGGRGVGVICDGFEGDGRGVGGVSSIETVSMSSATTSSRSSTKLELPTLSAAPSAAHTASSGTPSAEGQSTSTPSSSGGKTATSGEPSPTSSVPATVPTAAAPEVGHHLGLALLSTILALYTVI
ncbi:hypothetical protein VFPFJ_04185 [Purpureocillium lilacinum]|uniref:Uncharacterized protein n=1 Tax=Purpureocillium lilacinum TaxID=33203 RepID=A0A179HPS9_PURLI|nr:hypothetical protein VFPFJ_04185 [Purpureocillium lilacinum]OAQ92445.1 hypothetical protein VFPFJ_04185 [Purpureocillium lilacinum]